MKKHTLAAAALVALAAVSAYAVRATRSQDLPQLPAEPRDVSVTILEAHPFRLAEPATHWWRAEEPRYERGWVLVLDTDPELLVRRQGYEPVLYVGDETAQRVNDGADSGHLVAIVPDLDLDLANAPVFFGDPALPEDVTRADARAQLAAARAAGVPAQPDAAARASVEQVFPDLYELHWFASTLIEQYAPTEDDLILGLRAPRVGR